MSTGDRVYFVMWRNVVAEDLSLDFVARVNQQTGTAMRS